MRFLKVDIEEVMYVVKELWHGRSAREQIAKDVGRAMWRSINELMLVRLDSFANSYSKPSSIQGSVFCNLLLFIQSLTPWELVYLESWMSALTLALSA